LSPASASTLRVKVPEWQLSAMKTTITPLAFAAWNMAASSSSMMCSPALPWLASYSVSTSVSS
jgi:hypothetical protein